MGSKFPTNAARTVELAGLTNPRLTAGLLVSILAAGALLAGWLVARTDREMRADLLRQTRLVAQALNVERIQALAGNETDLRSPVYPRLKEQLAAVRSANPRCRFLYLMGRKADGTLFFFMDSEPSGAQDYSPPGQVFTEAPAGFRRAFTTQTEMAEGPYSDRWGTWVSALIPIRDPHQSGAILAVLGMDIDARAWKGRLARAALPPALLTLAWGATLLTGSILLARRARRAGAPTLWMRRLEPALVAITGAALTLFAAWVAHEREAHYRLEAFEQLADSRTRVLAEALRHLRTTGLEGLARFYENSDTVTPDEFQRFTAYLAENPAVQAWEWIQAVPAVEKKRYEAEARATRGKDFEIWQRDARGKRVPATGRERYYPVFQVAPLAGNERALGYDLGSEPLRRAAIEEAIRTGLPTATEPITLVQESGTQKGMLLYRPVFDAGPARRPRGFALAVLRMGMLLKNAGPDNSVPMELTLLRPSAAPVPLAQSWDAGRPPVSDLRTTRPILGFGKAFAVTASAGPEFTRLHRVRAGGWATLTGLGLTAALALALSAMLRRREELERLVFKRTAALRQSEEHLSATLHSMTHDITERKRTEVALRDSESRLRTITDSAQDAILMMDAEGRISFWNPAAERILGYTSAEAIGRNLHSLIVPSRYHPAHHAAFPAFRQSGTGSAVGKTLDLAARQKDGREISVQLSLSAIQVNGCWHAVGMLRDITQRRQAEEALLKTNRDLQAATARAHELAAQAGSANAAKSEFLANMSHEIRTPMNGVIGMTGLLLDTELNDEQRHFAQTVRASGESLLGLINDILDFSKIEAKKLDLDMLDFDLASLLEDFAATLAMRAREKGLQLTCAAEPAVPTRLRGDPGRLRQILTNLAGNAVKFTLAGEVAVRVSLVERDAHEVLLRFAVRDTGIGIPADRLGRLFNKFSQVDASTTRQYGGTGLGLAISKQLAGLMGGEAGASSLEGKGSEFWFTARLGQPTGEAPAESRPAAPRRDARALVDDDHATHCGKLHPFADRKARVLVAEDNITNQQVAVGILTRLGLRAEVAANGAEALKALETLPYDLVLMDVQMPEMDGLEATRQIRAPQSRVLNRRVPIIALTAHAMQGDRERCLAAGMDDHLAKPVGTAALLAALEKWFAGERRRPSPPGTRGQRQGRRPSGCAHSHL